MAGEIRMHWEAAYACGVFLGQDKGGRETYLGEEVRDAPDEVEPAPDLDERRPERAAHPPQQHMEHLQRREALHERRLCPDCHARARGPPDGGHEHRWDGGLDLALDRSYSWSGRDRGVRAVEVEDGVGGDEQDVRPAGGGEEVVEDEVVLHEGRRTWGRVADA